MAKMLKLHNQIIKTF